MRGRGSFLGVASQPGCQGRAGDVGVTALTSRAGVRLGSWSRISPQNAGRHPRWRSRHEGMEVTATGPPDSNVMLHYPIGCSNCGQTHVLNERPSFSGGASMRFRCQRCHTQVRASMCTCRTCGSKLVHCRCSVAGAHSTPTQRPLAAFFAQAAARLAPGEPGPSGAPARAQRASSAPAPLTHAGTRRQRRDADVARSSLAAWLRSNSQE